MIDYAEIETKWQKAWYDAHVFEGEVSGKASYFVTAAWPYVNTPLHIGHIRTYGTADVLARYKRMRGYNVLYPMGFHATGTPVLAFAKRIRENDKEIIEELRTFHIPDQEIAKMTDPVYIANYFIKEIGNAFMRSGFSIDWRRKFISVDPFFSKFVEWQFGILNEGGYLTKGKHPVGWCPNENNAVGMHDTKHDVEPDIEAEIAVKFKVVGEDASLICSTYRPETIFGVTNLFVKQDAKYALCKIDGDTFYISKGAAGVLAYQRKVEIVKEVDASEILSKKCSNPLTGEELPVLPGFFVKEEVGTGVVMSVPAHAPFDYAALERLRASGYRMPEIKPKKVLDVKIGRSLSDVSVGEAKPSQLEIPALAYLEILHTKPDAIDDMLEFATKLEYREESHWGKMIIKGYEGMSEPEAREKIENMLLKNGNAIQIYVLQNAPVYCRCGFAVVIKIVEDQWFIDYGNKKWKATVKAHLAEMKLLPEKTESAFAYTVDWLGLKAVSRKQGLGTKFPYDKTTIIESLSDSTIYTAFYTISHIVRNMELEKLKPEFFDYVFRNKGDAESVEKSTGIDFETLKKCKELFEYWYTDTSRHSAPDLIQNHLTMYIFNHVAVFHKKYWPKQIVTNGFVLSEGEKMSKSLGNIVPVMDGISKFGADPLRINEIAGSDLSSDSEFSDTSVRGIQERLDYLHSVILGLDKLEAGELKHIDYWLYSRLSNKIEMTTKAMDILEMRAAYIPAFYDSALELRRYFARGGKNVLVLREYLSSVVLMLQPIAPHMAEEMWHMLGNNTFASVEKWPIANKQMLNEQAEAGEKMLDSTVEDAKQVIALMQRKGGKKAKELRIVVAADWKGKLINALVKEKKVGKALESLSENKDVDREAAAKLAGMLVKKLNEIREVKTTQKEELESLREGGEYIAKQLGCAVVVESEKESKSQRAGRALPLKPSLDVILS